MDIVNAITVLRDGDAVKLPTFSGGYISRTDVAKTNSDTWDEKFILTFVTYSSGGSTPTEYAFTVTRTGEAYSVTLPTGGYTLDAQMFVAMFFSSEWTLGKTSEFEAARTGQTW